MKKRLNYILILSLIVVGSFLYFSNHLKAQTNLCADVELRKSIIDSIKDRFTDINVTLIIITNIYKIKYNIKKCKLNNTSIKKKIHLQSMKNLDKEVDIFGTKQKIFRKRNALGLERIMVDDGEWAIVLFHEGQSDLENQIEQFVNR